MIIPTYFLLFHGDLVYKFKRIVGKSNFSDQFKKVIKRYTNIGYNMDIKRRKLNQGSKTALCVYLFYFMFVFAISSSCLGHLLGKG